MSAFDGATGTTLFTLLGEELGNQFGRAVRTLGDLDGDGVGDFVTSAPHDDARGYNAGRVLFYSGAVTDRTLLESRGGLAAGQLVWIRHLATNNAASLILADFDPGPTPIPPIGHVDLGFSAALTVLEDSAGLFGPQLGNGTGGFGLSEVGPYPVDPTWAGVTVYLQAVAITPRAPNGVFQLSQPLSLTF